MPTINGAIITDFGSYDIGEYVFTQADGKITVIGLTSGTTSDDLAIARYNADGSLDNTFDGDGKLIAKATMTINAVRPLSDGKFITVGTSNNKFAVTRYNNDGSLDKTFDTDGKVTTGIYSNDSASAVTVQADGKLVVVGGSASNYGAVARYDADGTLDTSFSRDGKWGAYDSNSGGMYATAVAVQPDGKSIIAGISGNNFAIVRLDRYGNLDTSFNDDGKLAVDLGGTDIIKTVTVLGSGKILAAGTSDGDFALVRYNANGSLDTSFDTDGKLVADLGGTETLNSLIALSDGKFLAAGTDGNNDMVLMRFNSDGSFDTSFDTDGKVTTDLGGWETGNSVTVQSDGKILLAGTTDSDSALVRYNTDGSLDTGFNGKGTVNHLPTGAVSITGNAVKGQTLSAANTLADADGLGTISYLWQANGVNLGTGNSYTLTANEIGKTVTATAQYTDLLGTAESVSSTATAVVADTTNNPPTGKVTITGNAVKGQTLSAANTLADADGLGAISYQWQANGVNIGTGNSYTLTGNEIGKTVTATAQYTDLLGTAESVSSAATSAVTDATVSGTPGVSITAGDLITSEQGDTAVFSVKLNSAPTRDVTLAFTSSDTSEGVISNPTMKFTSANWATAQTFTVTGQNDSLVDGDIAYTINANLTTLDVIYKKVTVGSLTLTNQDTPVANVVTLNGTDDTDILQGLSEPNYILGKAGDDDLSGGAGNDTIYGSYGSDLLFGEDDNDVLYGEQDADYLEGGNGNDTLDGGLGVDTLIGGAGNDTYYLGYDAADVINDQGAPTDVDVVIMPYQLSKYTLPTGIEQGTIAQGTGASSLTGNTGNNALTGNDGNNMLNGAVGRDSLFGGVGNDVLIGGTGNDTLSGGTGKDTFKFNAPLKANTDKITDFIVVDDTIQLENSIFTKLKATGVLNADNFTKAATAQDSNDYILYNSATGAVSYDADGIGSGVAVQVALLGVDLSLTFADFVVI
ncbi:MAG: hypothetical protein NTY50_02355 [Methylobacter sp.]|nr:hypothetical protein [Methylobacter sp.]